MFSNTDMKDLIRPTIEQPRRTAAIYVRISKDRVGAGLGVERQENDCRKLAEREGYEVVTVFSDNDISAYSGKKRPGYQALLAAMKSGAIQAVFAWHTDRVHRRPTELEPYIEASDQFNIPTFTVQAGPLRLDSPSGRMGARIHGAVASYEVEIGIERQKAAKLQAAENGEWSGGQRPFGWLAGAMQVDEREAAVVREIIDRFIAGTSWRTIALDLNARGIRTQHDKGWNALKVRNIAIRPRNVGLRDHNGTAQYEAKWEALVDQDTWQRLQTAIVMSRNHHTQRGPFRKHLLKGFAYCGRCGNQMNSFSKQQRDGSYKATYRCRAMDDEKGHIGCGAVSRLGAPVEDLVKDAVFFRLESDNLGRLVSASSTETPKLRQLLADRHAQEVRLSEIVSLYGSGDLTFEEYKAAKSSAASRLDELSRRINAATASSAYANIPIGSSLSDAWDGADLLWRRELLDLIVDRVWIDPVPRGESLTRYKSWTFNPVHVRIDWKV
ncbi:recombinase family protein [Rathayibacter festucae]|nr:recombinase family protein [Rathayibacter festucae]